MKYTVKTKRGTDTQLFLQYEKLKCLRNVLESMGVDVSDWDIEAEYTVDLRLFLRKKMTDNFIRMNETNDSMSIARNDIRYDWRVIEKSLLSIDSVMFVNFVIEISQTPGNQ
jgi:hypothetical protein